MDEFELTPEERMAFERLPKEAEPSRMLEERVVRSLREEGILAPATPSGISHGAPLPGGEGSREMRGGGGGRSGARRWTRPVRIPPWMLAASVAASLVLFGSGVLLGRAVGARSTAEAFLAVREQDAGQLALRIQEAGSAYVAALAALSDLRPAGGIGGLGQGFGGVQGESGGPGDTAPGQAGRAQQGRYRPGTPLENAGLSQAGLNLEQGREVAMGTLYGATYELARLDPGNADILQILQILEDRRARESGQQGDGRRVIWF